MQNFQFKIELKISWNILKNYDIHQFHSPAVSRDATNISNYSEPLRLLDLEADFISLSPDPSRSLSDPLDLDLDLDFDLERSFSSLLNDDKQH